MKGATRLTGHAKQDLYGWRGAQTQGTGERTTTFAASVHWAGQVPEGVQLDKAQLLHDDGNDKVELSGGVRLQIAPPQQNGDGTVPAWSLAAPHGRVRDLLLHGDGMVPGQAALNHQRTDALETPARQAGYEHQHSYKDERALWATFQAVVQISQLANWAAAPTKTSDPARSSAPSDAQPGTSPQRTE